MQAHDQSKDGLEQSAIKTYRYLRLGLAGVVLMLGVAVAVEVAFGDSDGILGSISAYYYTPVAGVFVGVLVATGFGLIMVKGREGWEDISLNVAGMLAPVVAFVPTPITEQVGRYSTGGRRTVPTALVPTVHNNFAALLIVGGLGVLTAAVLVARTDREKRGQHAWAGLALVSVVVAAGALWYWLDRDSSLLEFGHYVAAIPMFLLLVFVAVMNARWAGRRERLATQRVSPQLYGRVYGAVAALMGAVLGGAFVAFLVAESRGSELPTGWLFWVESALLVLFAIFWLTQSAQNWNVGVPAEAEAAGGPAASVRREIGDPQVAPPGTTLPA